MFIIKAHILTETIYLIAVIKSYAIVYGTLKVPVQLIYLKCPRLAYL